MTRSPDPKSKTINIQVHGKSGEAEKIRAFKELHTRNGLKIRDTIMAAVDKFLKDHNWPPGNSQTLLFADKPLKECWRCHKKFPHLVKVRYISGKEASSCPACVERDRDKRLIKKVLGPV